MDAHPSPDPTTPALVGRDRELAALRDALAGAFAGRGSLVLIGGEAGIGKTALAEALLAAAREQGALVLVGRSYDLSETPPYGPWAEALARPPRDADLPALPTAMLPPARGGESLGSQEAIIGRVRDYLTALAARQPLVLLLDDLHWADPASLDLLRVLARGLADAPLLALATYRADEIGRGHPLGALIPLLVREARAARLALRPLDAPAIGALVAARYALGAADRGRLVRYLHERTEGNALFLGELLRTLEGEGVLQQGAAGGVLADLAAVPVPALLRQLIAGRLGLLRAETRQLLALAAIVGQEVPLALWAAVGDLPEDALLDHIEEATAARLLTETPDGAGVRFAHALIREAVYEGTPAIRRRAWHRRAADALVAGPHPDPDAVAHHLQRAGDPRAAAWLVRAGERAQDAYAWVTAISRFEAALAAVESTAGAGLAARERGWLRLRLGLLWRYADPARALAHLGAARAAADGTADAELAARAAYAEGLVLCFAGELAPGLAAMEDGIAGLEAALAARPPGAGPSPPWVERDPDHHRGTLALWLAQTGHLDRALALGAGVAARGAAPTARGASDPAFAADAWAGLGYAHAAGGRPAEARRAFARAREATGALGHHLLVGYHAREELRWVVLPYQADHLAGRRALAAEAGRSYGRAKGALPVLVPEEAILPLLLVEGRWAEARRWAEETWAGGAGKSWGRPVIATTLAPLARAQGDAARAWAVVRDAIPGPPEAAPEKLWFLDSLALLREGAALATDARDLATARAWLAAHDRWLTWSGAVFGQAAGQLAWAEYHRAGGDPAAAHQAAEAALAHATAPRQPLALIGAHRLLGELDTEAGRHPDAATHLAAALALADACAAPYERALTLLALAELRAAGGQPGAAGAPLDEARTVFADLGAAPALARAAALAVRLAAAAAAPAALPFGLTAREAEVLRLAARGLPSAAIAERLFVTPRTVGAHLTAIYTKLGVANRAAAIRVALDHDLH